MKNKRFAGKINKTYVFSKEELDKCLDFAQKVTSKDTLEHYGRNRNQSDINYIISQHQYGKCCEMAVSNWIKKQSAFSKIIKDVDFEIYNVADKNFSSDLEVEGKNGAIERISVKLSMFQMGGSTELLDDSKIEKLLPPQYSYLFQFDDLGKNGESGRDNGNHTIYMCGDKIDNKTIRISYWIRAKCVPRMLVLPFKENLKKIAIENNGMLKIMYYICIKRIDE